MNKQKWEDDPKIVSQVTALLGRAPMCDFSVVVTDEFGPVVIKNAPFTKQGVPMPTTYWLTSKELNKKIGQLESAGGVNQAESEVDDEALKSAHLAYKKERDSLIEGQPECRPFGGVGGCRTGVKCLHAHYAYFLAGGKDPVGLWVQQKLDNEKCNLLNDV